MHTLHTTSKPALIPRTEALLACALLLLALALSSVAPCMAFAEEASYTVTEVNIRAQVETNGSARIVEQRSFDFSGDCPAVKWQLDGLGEGQTRVINSVRVAKLANDAVEGEWESLSSTSFVSSWREGSYPSAHAYALDSANDALYTFFGATAGSYVVEIDYTIHNFAAAYEDVAEISWRYMTADWPAASENVTVTVVLPLPLDTEVTPGKTVRAWGHGPSNGLLNVGTDGSVVCTTQRVEKGQFADLHVLFPDEWLSNLSLLSMRLHSGQWRLSAALQQEVKWVDASGQNAIYGTQFDIVCCCVGALCVGFILLLYALCGRKYRPLDDEAARAEAAGQAARLEEDRPEVAIRLLRWNQWSKDDLVFAQGVSASSDMHEINAWQEALDARVCEEGLFDQQSFRARNFLLGFALVCVVVGLLLCSVTGGRTTPLVVGVACALAAVVTANYMPRRTQKGENVLQALLEANGETDEAEDHDGLDKAGEIDATDDADGANNVEKVDRADEPDGPDKADETDEAE